MTTIPSLAIAQFAPGYDRAANRATVRSMATDAAQRGATLVVFPEYSSYFSTNMGPDWVDAAEKIDGDFASNLSDLARELGVHIVAGMLEHATEPAKASNTVLAFAPDGELEATYRKIHLFDAFGELESEWIVPGPIEAPETFAWGGVTVGIQTCYDIRFPEVSRRLVDAGVELMLVPSEWVSGPQKIEQWRTLVAARAIENTVYIAAPDQSSPSGVGNSVIVDPMGIELATIVDGEGIALAEISAARVAEVRKTNPALQLRRL